MLPPFDDAGSLPPGIHTATLQEVEERFGRGSEIRRVQMESVRWIVDLAVRAGAERIILNGSFVADRMEPNDVDCVLLFSPRRSGNPQALNELRDGLPFLDIAIVLQQDFEKMVNQVFASDRYSVPKGMVEVLF